MTLFGLALLADENINPLVATLKAADTPAVELELPFILTIEHKTNGVRIRVRQLTIGG